MVKALEVKDEQMINKVATLAKEIWEEHYVPIIGQEQVDYMVPKFQSVPAITEQIEEAGYRYFLFDCEDEPAGYVGFQVRDEAIYLSKLYIRKEFRGKGVGKTAFELVESVGKEEGIPKIWLTVNRNNTGSIAVYLKKGFKKVREEKADIGGGYVMDDYIMEKEI